MTQLAHTRFSLLVLTTIFSTRTWVSRYQNIPFWILLALRVMEVVVNWSHKMGKAPVKLLPSTNQHPTFYALDVLPVAQPTVSSSASISEYQIHKKKLITHHHHSWYDSLSPF